MELTKRQRENLAKTLLDISKICVATLVIGPFLSGFRVGLVIMGTTLFLVLAVLGLVIDKGE